MKRSENGRDSIIILIRWSFVDDSFSWKSGNGASHSSWGGRRWAKKPQWRRRWPSFLTVSFLVVMKRNTGHQQPVRHRTKRNKVIISKSFQFFFFCAPCVRRLSSCARPVIGVNWSVAFIVIIIIIIISWLGWWSHRKQFWSVARCSTHFFLFRSFRLRRRSARISRGHRFRTVVDFNFQFATFLFFFILSFLAQQLDTLLRFRYRSDGREMSILSNGNEIFANFRPLGPSFFFKGILNCI